MKIVVFLLSLLNVALVQQSDATAAAALMNHLVGRWTMVGTLGGKQATHEADVRWVLNREYVEFHETSRERGPDGGPKFEAIVFLAWYAKTSEFMCMFLDNTVGGGLSPEGIARGKPSGNAIPLIFTLSAHESLHTTFTYDPAADSWRMTIDDVTDGKAARFGDMTLRRTDVSDKRD
jgi:hypothetical protein